MFSIGGVGRLEPVVVQAVKNTVAVIILTSDRTDLVSSVGCINCIVLLRFCASLALEGFVRTFVPGITKDTVDDAPENELQDLKK